QDPANPHHFTQDDVNAIWDQLQRSRMPAGSFGADNRPFKSLTTGATPPDDRQFPGGGIEDTLLRRFDAGSPRRPFPPPGSPPGRCSQPRVSSADDGGSPPSLQYELLTKFYNRLTTRSNVFAVWVTVGFFEVTDDAARPVKLGAEIGRAENRHRRHRLFALVDRATLTSNPGPQPGFDPRGDPLLVPCFSVID